MEDPHHSHINTRASRSFGVGAIKTHFDSTTIILYAQLLQSAFFRNDLDALATGVDRVLEKLFQSG